MDSQRRVETHYSIEDGRIQDKNSKGDGRSVSAQRQGGTDAMAYEVDIHAVGDESKSGDAIALRFGNFLQNQSDQRVIVIDGGFQDSGKKVVSRVLNQYKTNKVDLAISTHPDNDHISGLHVILEELAVSELWMHRPWRLSNSVKKLAEDRSITASGLSDKLKKSLESAYDLEKLAEKKGIHIVDPFQGLSAFDNMLCVLGPSEDFYKKLVVDFDKAGSMVVSSLLQKAKRVVSEVWHQDELAEPEDNAVSSRNNSSVILWAQLGGKNFLFTGDAGVLALNHAADYAAMHNYDLAARIHYHQIPHHGSKRNLGPSVLNRIIGPIKPEGYKNGKSTFISAAAKGDPKHPSKRVINALIRRGAQVTATCGSDHCFHSTDVPIRPNWHAVTPLEFCHSYDEEDET